VDVQLVPGGRGDFIVTADDESIWDKRKMGDRFPDPAEITTALTALRAARES
jgi:predicted Rdx family selenoprotein